MDSFTSVLEIEGQIRQCVTRTGDPGFKKLWVELEPIIKRGLEYGGEPVVVHSETLSIQPTTSLSDVVTVAEAVELTGLSQPTISRMIGDGKLEARRSGGTWLILKSSLPAKG